MHDPKVLILDEPASGLDPRARIEIREILRELQRMGKTILLSSHILSELEQVVDFMTMIDKGRIVVQGNMAELRARFSGNQFLVKTSHNEAILEEMRDKGLFREGWIDAEDFIHLISDDITALRRGVVEAIVRNGAELEHFSEERASLQDIYRKTMGMEEE